MNDTTKIAIALRGDLMTWQAANVSAFLASGIASAAPDLIGAPYVDGDGVGYPALLGTPVQVLVGDLAVLQRSLRRAHERGLRPAVYVADMFDTMDDAANRATIATTPTGALDLVGLAVTGPSREVDKSLDRCRRHP